MTSTDPSAARPDRRVQTHVLRPGLHVLRRSSGELQVGLAPERAVVLRDTDEVRRLLEALTIPGASPDAAPGASPGAAPGASPGAGCATTAFDVLSRAELLVDADVLLPLAPAADREADPSRGDISALAADAGDEAPARLAARQRRTVGILAAGARSADHLATHVAELLGDAGVVGAPVPEAQVNVLVAVGEPAREQVDPWVRSGTAHLLLRLVEGSAVVGPFVEPGRTACLRCVDAHHTDADPAWPLLVAQYASACTRIRADGLPEPVDPLLARLAAAWAARELVTWLQGDRPATTGATVRLDPRLSTIESHRWPLHPACGCTWG